MEFKYFSITPATVSTFESDFTIQTDDKKVRPALPDDAVASRVRFEQSPILGGANMTTVGEIGFCGAEITAFPLEYGSRAHVMSVPVHKARIFFSFNVTVSPIDSKLPIASDVFVKAILTMEELCQTQTPLKALEKVNTALHTHVALTMPAESVGELNITNAANPLSKN